MTLNSLKNLQRLLMQAVTPFREHLFDITAAIDVMDGVWLDWVSVRVKADYIFIACTNKEDRWLLRFLSLYKKGKLRGLDLLYNGSPTTSELCLLSVSHHQSIRKTSSLLPNLVRFRKGSIWFRVSFSLNAMVTIIIRNRAFFFTAFKLQCAAMLSLPST